MIQSVQIGILGGIAGGIVFGILMQMMGMMAMIAMMAGSESLFIGWLVHMVISIIFGAAFGLGAANMSNIWLFSIMFGILIWIIGPLVAMPLFMGIGTQLSQAFAPDQLMSLGTHIFYSLIVGSVYKLAGVKITKEKPSAA
ncbi:hypothetical protein [Salipaludibacillus aurantiacus]|uniref:Uncharacterized protein n=1 Tax=Salipaludibacillus aurantiacus TaxID=1601833 RepID=A0A1H9W4T3_9BACI|nr:hypothetical protein [Salipaludibacillus aurantiacus]SES28771.1 hypothetical protein SAMN05518684_11465 [Salipaludibacillus aurantiacus]